MNTASTSSPNPTLRARFVGQGYKQVCLLLILHLQPTDTILQCANCYYDLTKVLRVCQVCGQADVWGDGVVPEVSAHLEGAINISLDGVYHSPVGSDDATRPWYGSPDVLEQWIQHLLN